MGTSHSNLDKPNPNRIYTPHANYAGDGYDSWGGQRYIAKMYKGIGETKQIAMDNLEKQYRFSNSRLPPIKKVDGRQLWYAGVFSGHIRWKLKKIRVPFYNPVFFNVNSHGEYVATVFCRRFKTYLIKG